MIKIGKNKLLVIVVFIAIISLIIFFSELGLLRYSPISNEYKSTFLLPSSACTLGNVNETTNNLEKTLCGNVLADQCKIINGKNNQPDFPHISQYYSSEKIQCSNTSELYYSSAWFFSDRSELQQAEKELSQSLKKRGNISITCLDVLDIFSHSDLNYLPHSNTSRFNVTSYSDNNVRGYFIVSEQNKGSWTPAGEWSGYYIVFYGVDSGMNNSDTDTQIKKFIQNNIHHLMNDNTVSNHELFP